METATLIISIAGAIIAVVALVFAIRAYRRG